MKKSFILFIGIILSGLCYAQIQNGNFESWSGFSSSSPDGWYTSAPEAFFSQLPNNATKVSPGHSGNYALKLETIVTATDTIFAYFANTQDDPTQFKGGVPYTMKPDSFYCYAKLGIASQDTGLIIVIFKKNSIPISINMWQFKGNTPTTWTKLAYKLSPMAVNPDTVIIAAASSNAFNQIGITNGSTVIFDDLSFNTSQAIPNGGFENWTDLNAELPDGWNSDDISYLFLKNDNQIEKTTDAYKGNFALKMTTRYIPENDWWINWIGNGTVDNQHYSGVFPYAQQTDTLFGWYKYFPKAGDSAGFFMEFSYNGFIIDATGLNFGAASVWTKFELPLNISSVPDSATLTFFSSQWPFNVTDTGSVLYLDEVQFSSAPLNTGIEKPISDHNFKCFPNPGNGLFHIIYYPEDYKNAEFTIFDPIGRIIKQEKFSNFSGIIDLRTLPKGIYLMNIRDGNSILNKKLLLN